MLRNIQVVNLINWVHTKFIDTVAFWVRLVAVRVVLMYQVARHQMHLWFQLASQPKFCALLYPELHNQDLLHQLVKCLKNFVLSVIGLHTQWQRVIRLYCMTLRVKCVPEYIKRHQMKLFFFLVDIYPTNKVRLRLLVILSVKVNVKLSQLHRIVCNKHGLSKHHLQVLNFLRIWLNLDAINNQIVMILVMRILYHLRVSLSPHLNFVLRRELSSIYSDAVKTNLICLLFV
mmetsp:Transcript_14533/g.21921  ORF Transcript_14533/g.21921 Transcript_14533/m.21921 type:complete len:231 (+) Transcript_14533:1093-1785(+)